MAGLPSDNDYQALFEAIALSDQAAFKALFEQCRGRVYTIAAKWTKSEFAAEEITQDVFIGIWTARKHLAAVKEPRAYFYTILYNKIKTHLRKEANKKRILNLSLWYGKASGNDTEETIYANDSQRSVNKAVERLSPRIKLIYELKQKEGKSYGEIAKTLHLSPHTVKSHMGKAVKLIRNYLKNNALHILCGLICLLS